MKKVLICASRVSHIRNFHLPYIEYFTNKGYEVDIAVEGNTDNPMIHRCYDVAFTKNPLSPDNIKTIFKLRRIIKDGGYDIVYSNSTLAGAALKLAVMLVGKPKPYFVHISHGYMFGEKGGIKSKIYLVAEKLTKSPVDALAVMNREDMELARKYKLGKNLHYIHGMGLVTEAFPEISQRERLEFRKKAGADENTKVMLCIGEFSKRKNQTMLIEALEIISARHKNVMLMFAGEGKTLEECRKLTEKYELSAQIRFLGQVSNVNLLYRSCDILVSASKMEGLPFNVMEAMYCGLPVAASDIKGHSDLIVNDENGLLFENTAKSAAQALDRLLSDESLYERLKSNAGLDSMYYIEKVKNEVLGILDREYEPLVYEEYREERST